MFSARRLLRLRIPGFLLVLVLATAQAQEPGAPDALEPNNDLATATPLPPGETREGTISPVKDEDWYRVALPERGLLVLRLEPLARGTGPAIVLKNREGTDIASVVGPFPRRAELRFEAPGAGEYLAVVCDGPHGPGEGGYGHQWHTAAGETPYRLAALFTPAPDAAEPNDDAAGARPLDPGDTAECTVFPAGDRDHFCVDLPESARGILVATLVTPDPVAPGLVLFDPAGQQIAVRETTCGGTAAIRQPVTAGGRYTLLVQDGPHGRGEAGYGHLWNNASSTAPYRLTVRFVSAEDPGEPDEDAASARAIAPGTEAAGTLFPAGDIDHYRLEVPPGPTVLEVGLSALPAHMAPTLALIDPDGREHRRLDVRPGSPVRLEEPLPRAGVWTLAVMDGGHGFGEQGYGHLWRNQFTATPYRLRADLRPVPDRTEPNDSPESARDLPLDAPAEAVLFPAGDQDHYRIRIPEPARGRLRIDVEQVPEAVSPALLLYAGGNEVARSIGQDGRDLALTIPVRGTAEYVVAFRDSSRGREEHDWGSEWDNRRSDRPYRIRATFSAAPDAEPSEDKEHAVPLAPAEGGAFTGEGALWPEGDQDWFAVDLPAGEFEVVGEGIGAPVAPALVLLNADGGEIARQVGPVLGPDEAIRLRFSLPEPARRLIVVADGPRGRGEHDWGSEWNNAGCAAKYRLTVRTAPAGDEPPPAAPPPERPPAASSTRDGALPLAFTAGAAEADCPLQPPAPETWFALDVAAPSLLTADLTRVPGSADARLEVYAADGDRPVSAADGFAGVVLGGDERLFADLLPGRYLLRAFDADPPSLRAGGVARLRAVLTPVPSAAPAAAGAGPREFPAAGRVDEATWPAGDVDELRFPVAAPGVLEVRLDGVDAALAPLIEVYREHDRRLRALYVCGGRTDYNVPDRLSCNVDWTRTTLASLVTGRVLHHLGNDAVSEWPDVEATSRRWDFDLPSEPRSVSFGLQIIDQHHPIVVRANGREVGRFEPGQPPFVAIPPETLRAGANTLEVEVTPSPDGNLDDVLVHRPVLEGVAGDGSALRVRLEPYRPPLSPEALAGFDLVVLDGLTDPLAFEFDQPETAAGIHEWVEAGGRFVVMCPQGPSCFGPAARSQGGVLLVEPTSYDSHGLHARNLIDGHASRGWASTGNAPFPHDFVLGFAAGTARVVDGVALAMAVAEADRRPKEVEILVSDTAPDAGFRSVGKFAVEADRPWQAFRFPPTPARYVKVSILANHGDPQHTELGEIEVLVPGVAGGLLGARQVVYWSDEPIEVLADDDPVASAYGTGPWNGYAVSDQNGFLLGTEDAGFRTVAVIAGNPRAAVTVTKSAGKGLLILDTQEIGYPSNTAANWRLPNLLGFPDLLVARVGGSMVPNGADPHGRSERLLAPAREAGAMLVRVQDAHGAASRVPWTLSVALRECGDPQEPDDSTDAAAALPAGRDVRATIDPPGDVDVYRLEVPQPSLVRLTVEGTDEDFDPAVTVRPGGGGKPLAVLDGTLAAGRGSGESGAFACGAGSLLVEVRDANPLATALPYRITADVAPFTACRPGFAYDAPHRAAALPPGTPMPLSLDPPGASPAFVIWPREGSEVEVRIENVPPSADPCVDVYAGNGPGGVLLPPLRGLYLAGRGDFHLEDLWPTAVRWTRIDPGHADARAMADRFGEFDIVILDALLDPDHFGAYESSFAEKARTYVEGGGRFLVLSPCVSASEIAAVRGGRVVRRTSQWDEGKWAVEKLIDGRAIPGNPTGGWCCASGKVAEPQEMVFEVGGGAAKVLDRIIVYATSQAEDRRAREVELSVGAVEEGTFDTVATAELEPRDGPQIFRFPPREARFVRIVVRSNRGNGAETQLGEVEAYGPASPAFFGLRPLQSDSWLALEAPDAAHALAGGVVPPSAERLARQPVSTVFDDVEAAGYEPLLTCPSLPGLAAAAYREIGKGVLVVEGTQVGNPGSRAETAWRLANLLGRGDPFLGTSDGTTGPGRGGPEVFSIVPPRAGPCYLVVREREPLGGLAPLTVEARYEPDPALAPAPAVALVSPAEGTEGVPVAGPVTLFLTRPASGGARVTLSGATSGAVPVEASLDESRRVLTVRPGRPFAPGEAVAFRYDGGLTDDLGREFPAGTGTSFSTARGREEAGFTVSVETSARIIGPRPVAVRIRSSAPLAGPPQVFLAPAAGGRVPLVLRATADQEWEGEVTAPAGTPDGAASFAVEARAADGRASPAVRAPTVRVDLTPPAPPRSPVLAAGPRGRVDASFPACPPGDGVAAVVLLRETSAGPVEAGRLTGAGPGTISDRGAGAGRTRYRLAAEDDAGNRSAPSEPVEIEVTGPGLTRAVEGVTAEAKGGAVVVVWQASEEAGVDGYSVYRREDARAFDPLLVPPTILVEAGRLTATDRPRNGRFTYYVVARDRQGNPSPLSAAAEVLLDTAAPVAEVRAQPWRRLPGEVALDLVVSEVLAEPPTLALSLAARDPLPVTLTASGDRAFRGTVVVPADAPDGEARFLFAGTDPSGNRGEWITTGATLYVDQAPPTADVYLDPGPPLRGGTKVRLALILHEEIDGPPRLTLTATGLPPEVSLSPTGDPRRFEAELALPDGLPDGVARFALSARDAFGHEGGRVLRSVEVTVGDGPPRPLYESGEPPTGEVVVEEGSLPLRISLVLSKSCSEVRLALRTADGAEHAVPLTGSGDRWRGELALPDSAADGPATFLLTARDLTGQTGSRLHRGEMLLLSRRAPPPPQAVAAAPRAGGRVRVAWDPPAPAEPLPVPVAGYRIRRAAAGGGEETLLAETVKSLEYADDPPSDGEWRYSVSAVSRTGVEGKAAPAVSARSDREPPAAPPAPVLAPADRGAAVRVETVLVPDAVTYRVYRSSDGAEFAVAGETDTTAFTDPAPGGRLAYAVAAVDAAGNESPRSPAAEIDFASSLPTAEIAFSPAGVLTARGGTVTLRTSLPLTEPPDLALVAPDDTEVSIPLTGSDSEWSGPLPDLSPLPAGRARIRFTGRRTEDGRVFESGLVRGAVVVEVDARPPVFTLRYPAGTPVAGERHLLRAGEYRLVLVADEPLAGPPRLTFTPAGRTEPVEMPLSPADGGYATTLPVDAKTGDGPGLFEVRAEDARGNSGGFLESGKVAVVRTAAPGVLPAVRVAALTRGRVFVAWEPPAEGDVRRFEVFRLTAPPEGTAPPASPTGAPTHVVDRALGVEDRPGGGRFLYAARAVDPAGNTGPLSAWAAAEVDTAPPEAPAGFAGEVLKGGTVHLTWQPPPGEGAAYYNVYFAEGEVRDPARARRLNEMYPFTEIYGAPPDDGTFTFFVTAVDARLNESPPSAGVLLTVSDRPPVGTVRVFDEAGARVNRLRVAEFRVEVSADQALSAAPALSVTWFGAASPREIPLAAEGAAWRGRLVVPPDVPPGAAYFAFRGTDEQGNEGKEIVEGEYLEVDTAPPLPVRDAAAATDTTDRLGAIDVTWRVPEGEVPHFYRIWRRPEGAPDTEWTLLTRFTVERVTERYVHKDTPPADGSYVYRVEAVDLAGNTSPPSADLPAESKTTAPKAALEVRTGFSAGRPVTAVGLGRAEVVLTASAPLAGAPRLSIAIEGWSAEIPLSPADGAGLVFTGAFAVDTATPEGEARFTFEGRDREGRTGSFLSSGAAVTIDRTPAEAAITIEDLFELRPNRYTGKLERIPARPGPRRVRVETTKALAAAPVLEAAPGGTDDFLPVPLSGGAGDAAFAGTLALPRGGPEGAWRFRIRMTDLMGNESDVIAPPKRSFRTDEPDDPEAKPRILQTFETTGRDFTVDVVPPETPEMLTIEHLKLGVMAMTYAPKGEKPITWNLYRSLTPIVSLDGLTPVRKDIRAETIVDDPPADGRYFYAVTALDAAGNESPPSNNLSAVVDSIKPELKIKPVPTEDFVVIEIETDQPSVDLYLRFPGGPKQAVLGGDSGELTVEQDPETGKYVRRLKLLPQQLEVFNGKVEIVVYSPDPAGNVVEQTAEIAAQPLNTATGAVVESVDQGAALVIPPGAKPVIPSQPQRQVADRGGLVFLRYEHIPRDPKAPKESPRDPDPLPLELEMVSKPYRVELNQDVQEPMELLGAASQARMPELPKIVFSVNELADFGDQFTDPEFMKSRIKVVRWTPPEPSSGKKGRWEPVPEIEIDLANWKVIAPAEKVTSYVVVAETTPPSVRDMEPAPEAVVTHLRPALAARVVDKGTGVAVGPENRVSLRLDGEVLAAAIDDADPTEVLVRFTPEVDLAPGPHVVTLYAEDVVENKRTATWRFTIDTEPPRILSRRPAPDRPTAAERPLVGAEVLDTGGGIDEDSISLRLDGAALAARYDPASGLVLGHPPAPLGPGAHRVEIVVADRGGEKTKDAFEFTVDREGPEILRSEPGPAAARTSVEEVLVVLADRTAGLDPGSVKFALDGTSLGRGTAGAEGYAFTPETGVLVYRPATPLAEGSHEVSVEARDALGNGSRFAWRFSVDRVPPVIETIADWRPDLAGPLLALRLTDADSGIEEGAERVEVAGVPVPPEALRAGGLSRLFLRLSPEGAGRRGAVVVSITDRAGNRSERSFDLAPAAGPPDRAAALAAAEEARAAGRLGEAERLLSALLIENPRDSRARNLLALVWHGQGRRDEALRALRTLVAEDPLYAAARWNLALALEAAGEFRAAAEAYEFHLRLEPEGPWADKARARISSLSRRIEEGGR